MESAFLFQAIHTAVYSFTSIAEREKTYVEVLQKFVRHVVLSGGTTIFQGIVEDVMTNELTALAPSTMIKVAAPVHEFPDRNIIAVSPNISVVRRIAPATFSQTETSFPYFRR